MSTSSLSVVKTLCLGKNVCSIDVTNDIFGGDPCPGNPKTLSVVAHCSSGGGQQPNAPTPPRDRISLPSYVTSVTVDGHQDGGLCATRFSWTNGTSDTRALSDPEGGLGHLGYMQPCGCPTAPIDILLTDAAKAAGKRYRLSLYFVDYAPSQSCGGLDGTSRSQEVYLLTGYPTLAPAVERQYLSDFTNGLWLSYELSGDIRVRISTIRGDMAVISALMFDPIQ